MGVAARYELESPISGFVCGRTISVRIDSFSCIPLSPKCGSCVSIRHRRLEQSGGYIMYHLD